MAEFNEKAKTLLSGTAGFVTNVEQEAEVRFERFIARSLKWLEEQLSPKSLILAIWDEQLEQNAFHVRLSRDTGKWKIEEEAAGDMYRSPSAGMRSTSKFALKSQFCYGLDLPPRWAGMATLEFSGIAFLNPQHDAEIRSALRHLSKDLTIILLAREVADLEKTLTQERKTGDEMRAFVAALSKELYCVSSISNALVQSYNVEEVLTRVLEQMLPFLRASLGVIYFPETGQCVSFHFPRRLERQEEPWFRRYFQSKMPVGLDSMEQTSFHTQSVADHPTFPARLKDRLATQGIDYVLEFGLHCRNEFLGLGLVGLQREQPPPTSLRLLMISLNMIGLFLEHIILIQDLERQVKLVSQEKLEMEKRNRFLLDYVGTRSPGRSKGIRRISPTERLLDEIERSRNAALLAELASGVAHQIRNPLSNLLYALHLLKQEGINEGEKRELIDSATERVENINRTISQFIQYTRIPKLHLSLESINDVVANTVRSFNGWMDLKAINLEVSLDQLLPSTRIDIFLINQAFHDIIKNALEATQDCGDLRVSTRKLNLRHGPEPRLEFAEIIFEDNGPGIEPEDLEKVLKPFYSKKEGGLGLGLALVDHVIRAHGGAVTLTNRQGGGTRVKIYLPIR